MDGVKLTDAQVAALAAGCREVDAPGGVYGATVLRDSAGTLVGEDEMQALAREAQDFRALQAVIATATRDVSARLITPYDALARIVMELASLDSVGTTDGR